MALNVKRLYCKDLKVTLRPHLYGCTYPSKGRTAVKLSNWDQRLCLYGHCVPIDMNLIACTSSASHAGKESFLHRCTDGQAHVNEALNERNSKLRLFTTFLMQLKFFF